MIDNRLSVLHHVRDQSKDDTVLQFLASILAGRRGNLDLIYVKEILTEITDDARKDLAKQQRQNEKRPEPNEILTETKKRLGELIPEFDLNTVSASGDPVDEVMNQLSRKSYDLLSLEAYGKGGFSKNILGAHVNKIVRQSTIPTLVHKGEFSSCERLLIHVPNDKQRCTRLVSYLTDLMGGSKPAITFLVILKEEGEKFEGYTSGEEEFLLESIENYAREEFGYLDIAKDIINEAGMDGEVRYRIGDVYEEILAEAKEGRYDLLAFSPKKQNVLTSLWSGNKSMNVMRDIDISVLKFLDFVG